MMMSVQERARRMRQKKLVIACDRHIPPLRIDPLTNRLRISEPRGLFISQSYTVVAFSELVAPPIELLITGTEGFKGDSDKVMFLAAMMIRYRSY